MTSISLKHPPLPKMGLTTQKLGSFDLLFVIMHEFQIPEGFGLIRKYQASKI
jgi:hypothetical protein